MAKFADIDDKGQVVTKPKDTNETTVYPLPEAIGGQEWGPYYNLELITNEFGEFGVPRGKVMYFVLGPKKDPDGREFIGAIRMFRDATEAEQAHADKMHAVMRQQMEAAG